MFAARKMKLAIAALTLGLPAAGLADTGDVRVTGFAPEPLVVTSNGQEYTKLTNFGMTNVQIRFQYDTAVGGRVKSWKVWPYIVNGFGIAATLGDLESNAYSKSYSLGNRPKVVDRTVAVSIPAALYRANALFMCNLMADNLRNQGKSNHQIFSQNRDVSFRVNTRYKVNATGAGSGSAIFQANPSHIVKVRCSKWQGSQIPQAGNNSLKNPLHVKKATMKLREIATKAGACGIKLTTAISTNTAGATVKYRFEHSNGKKSKVFTTKTAQNKIAVVTHQWDVPNGPGREIGKVRLVGMAPKFSSNNTTYNMNCVKAPGRFKANPGKAKVRIPLGSTRLKN